MIKNDTNKIGLLPIRTGFGNHYPKPGQYMIGTWTHEALNKALQEGYILKHIQKTLSYDYAENPFIDSINRFEQLKKNSINKLDKYVWKMCVNASLGKFAQRKSKQELLIDSVEKCEEYLEHNYRVVNGIGTDYMYKKDVQSEPKPYYAPIIAAIVNAKGANIMHDHYKRVKPLYTDTDSIITQDDIDHLDIGTEPGQFKIEARNTTAKIWGRS